MTSNRGLLTPLAATSALRKGWLTTSDCYSWPLGEGGAYNPFEWLPYGLQGALNSSEGYSVTSRKDWLPTPLRATCDLQWGLTTPLTATHYLRRGLKTL